MALKSQPHLRQFTLKRRKHSKISQKPLKKEKKKIKNARDRNSKSLTTCTTVVATNKISDSDKYIVTTY